MLYIWTQQFTSHLIKIEGTSFFSWIEAPKGVFGMRIQNTFSISCFFRDVLCLFVCDLISIHSLSLFHYLFITCTSNQRPKERNVYKYIYKISHEYTLMVCCCVNLCNVGKLNYVWFVCCCNSSCSIHGSRFVRWKLFI